MNLSRCFRLLLVLALLAVPVGVAAGVTVSEESAPTEAEAGSRIEASFTLTELYQNPSFESWTVRGDTELRNVTWTFELTNQAGNVVETNSVDGQNATQDVNIDDGISIVTIRVVGDVPPVENFTYDPAPAFLVAQLRHTREGGTSSEIKTYGARHYTPESLQARQAIESAQAAIDAAGGHPEAEGILESAKSAYEAENFQNAADLAMQAERQASNARQSQERTRLAIYGVIGLIVVAILVGLVYWFLNRDTGSRL